ncbi:hypothetical protein D3C73_983010 [compost metagenome]
MERRNGNEDGGQRHGKKGKKISQPAQHNSKHEFHIVVFSGLKPEPEGNRQDKYHWRAVGNHCNLAFY